MTRYHQFFKNNISATQNEWREKNKVFADHLFFRTMLHLVFGAGGEGAEQALLKVFDCDLDQSAPHRSSFCRQRKQLSWRYFHDLFYGLLRSIDSHRTTKEWHSKTLNGILQELYCAMWLINYPKICMLLAGEKNAHPLEVDYEKSNFKACCKFVVEKIGKYWNQPKRMINKMIKIVSRTKQKRKRYSRSYPREIKSPQSPYVYNNTRPSGADPPPGMRTSINPD